MSTVLRAVVGAVFASLLAVGLVAGPAAADVSVRDGKTSDLTVRADRPSTNQLERQFAAFWNPNVPMSAKYAATYNGSNPKAQASLKQVMASSNMYDFFSIQGRFGAPSISGDRMSATGSGVMSGVPATSVRYHWIREGGQWKYDWKKICQGMKCHGNPSFGY